MNQDEIDQWQFFRHQSGRWFKLPSWLEITRDSARYDEAVYIHREWLEVSLEPDGVSEFCARQLIEECGDREVDPADLAIEIGGRR